MSSPPPRPPPDERMATEASAPDARDAHDAQDEPTVQAEPGASTSNGDTTSDAATSATPTAPLPATTASTTPSPSMLPTAAPTSPLTAAAPVPTVGSAPMTTAPEGTAPGAGPSSPNQPRRGQRPLSSMSFFIPFGGQQAGPEGPQVGLTWTLEVFGDNEAGPAGAGLGQPQAAAGGEANAAAPNGGQHPEAAAAPLIPADSPRAGARAPEEQANEAHNPPPTTNQNRNDPGANRSVFFFVGPDGMLHRGDAANVDDAAPPPFPFAFPFPFPFQAGPPPPDPAKAAELLNSLPTVGRALLKRVDKIVAAEDAQRGDSDSSGWQCGICLEGLDVGETVKALPCNHLFHEACLQPWFTNHHHTCPTCRLNLDPLRTLHEPARRAPLRPMTTGSGRGTPATRAPHPYARPGAAGANGANAEGRRSRPASQAGTQPGTPQNERAEGGGDRLEVPTNPLDAMFDLARMFGMTTSPAPMREGEQREGDDAAPGDRQNQPNNQSGAQAAEAPAAEANAGAGTEQATTPAADGLARPTPERRRHITIFHIDHSGGHREHHVHGAPDGGIGVRGDAEVGGAGPGAAEAGGAEAAREATPPTAPDARADATPAAAPAPAPDPAPAPLPADGVPPWFTIFRGQIPLNEDGRPREGNVATENNAPAPPNDAAPSDAVRGATPGAHPTLNIPPMPGTPMPGMPGMPDLANLANRPNPVAPPPGANPDHGAFRFPFELVFLRPPPGGGAPPPPPAENQPPAAPEREFVPQSLESWTAQREKTLGWRCDAVECLIAPPVPDADTMDVDAEDDDDGADAADKEMLAIYAENQPPFPPRKAGSSEQPHTGQEFVLLACAHRWHRACLETAARSAGHSTVPDASGREWIRCVKCRKDGWIVPREPAPAAVAATL